jgi:hypothetical protein
MGELYYTVSKRCEGVDWIHVAQDRAQLRAFMNTVMNFRVPYMLESFLAN